VDGTQCLENPPGHQTELEIAASDNELDHDSPYTLISRNIELTTTRHMLATREILLQPSFSFFVEAVDCPLITAFDSVNWGRMKQAVVELGIAHAAVASTIVAVSALYKVQLYGLPFSSALSLYETAKCMHENFLKDENKDFEIALATAFLLCLFDFIQSEATPLLKESREVFVTRLGNWAKHKSSHSALSSRIVTWFRVLQAAAIRGGGSGLISDRVYSLLPVCEMGLPNLRSTPNRRSDISTYLYEVLSTPLVEFYFRLQLISGEIATLTHYHRSRTTGADQEEIVQEMDGIKSRLQALWESRSDTQRETPEDLRSHLDPKIANPIITLIGLCMAAYHAEFIEIGRVLGDPVSESTDSMRAIQRIREIIDGDWNAYDDEGRLNSGYLRPIFLSAIESMDRSENQWAVEKLEQIRNPICRSGFFAAFGKALSDAQLLKDRRVTSKYFCIRHFGVPPPFM
jgi:hypothetical protein